MPQQNAQPRRMVIIRHAESLRNAAKKGCMYFADDEARNAIRGIPDHNIGLTDKGYDHARRISSRIFERFGTPRALYHSEYLRTIQTMEGILSAYPDEEKEKILIRGDLALRERGLGYMYDMLEKEVALHFPWLQEHRNTNGDFFACPPGGESLVHVADRVKHFFQITFQKHANETIFLITHSETLRVIRYLLEDWTYDQAAKWPPGESPSNCGITVYEYDDTLHRLVLREYNTVY